MRIFTGISGRIKREYNFKLTLAKLPSHKFLCTRAVKIDNATVNRLINSPKYLVKSLIFRDETTNLSEDFAKLNGFEFGNNTYYKENSCGIYAVRNKINGADVVEMCLIKTFRRPDSISVSLYYIPNGDIRNICFVARVCQHQTNKHRNTDGSVIEPGQTHLHIYTEEYFNKMYKIYGNSDTKKLAEKLQSPDAILLPQLKNQDEIVNYAMNAFNVTGKELEAYAEDEQRKGYFINKDGKFVKGLSKETLKDKMGEGME